MMGLQLLGLGEVLRAEHDGARQAEKQVRAVVPGRAPADYQAILEIVAGARDAAKAGDVALALGKGVRPAQVESVRGQLRRLAERGWLHRTPAGRYTLR